MTIKSYKKQFTGQLHDVYSKRARFLRTFGGAIQVVDAISDNEQYLILKTEDTDVVLRAYDTNANVGFGTGTGKSSRFGERKEIKATTTTVPYDGAMTSHEGIDKVTVNDVPQDTLANRGLKTAEAWTEHVNKYLANYLLTLGVEHHEEVPLSFEVLDKTFNEVHKAYVNADVDPTKTWVAYVTPDAYQMLVDSGKLTSAKGSTVNLDRNEVKLYKGFVIEETPERYFDSVENCHALFTVDGIGQVGVGLSTYRVLDSEDFDGVAIQSLGRYGKYVPTPNQKVVHRLVVTPEM